MLTNFCITRTSSARGHGHVANGGRSGGLPFRSCLARGKARPAACGGLGGLLLLLLYLVSVRCCSSEEINGEICAPSSSPYRVVPGRLAENSFSVAPPPRGQTAETKARRSVPPSPHFRQGIALQCLCWRTLGRFVAARDDFH